MMFGETRQSVVVILFVLMLSTSCATAGPPMNLKCTGILTEEDGELQLKPDAGSALCRGAIFEKDYEPKIFKRARTTCGVRTRCRIRGIVRGYAGFFGSRSCGRKDVRWRFHTLVGYCGIELSGSD